MTFPQSWVGRLSSWAGLGPEPEEDSLLTQPMEYLAPGYRLTSWPELPGMARTARLLRALSVMSHRSVSVVWFASQVGWTPDRSRAFMEMLAEQGHATRVGTGQYAASERAPQR